MGQRLVELDDLGLQQQDVPHAREARAGVVDRDARAVLAKPGDAAADRPVVVDHHVLGEFEHETRADRIVDQVVELAREQQFR